MAIACGGSDFPTTAPVTQGTAVTDAGLTMTVTNTSLKVTGGHGYEWGPYVIVKVHVSNNSGNQAFFAPMLQDLFINGREHAPNATCAEAVDDKTSSAAALIPRSEADIALAFGVPDEAKPPLENKTVQLVLHGAIDSPGAVVSLPNSQLAVIYDNQSASD